MSAHRHLVSPARDSLELGSLASSSRSARTSTESSRSGITSSRRLSLEEEDPLHEESSPATARISRHSRSLSGSSAFDFTSNLIPLSSTTNGGQYAPIGAPTDGPQGRNPLEIRSLEQRKHLTFLNGLSLLVSLVIGSGIFSTPRQVNINAGSPGAALVVWLIAGILAWTGASSYAELGSAIPLNGGAQIYLAKIFGGLAGFLFSWCCILVQKPGTLAVVSIIMGEYLVKAVVGAEAEEVSPWINKGMAIAGLSIVVLLNCLSTKIGTRLGDMFMFLKLSATIGITIIGIVVATTGLSASGPASTEWKTQNWFEGTSTSTTNWAVAIYGGLWAFDGWDNVSICLKGLVTVANRQKTSYVVGEFKNPNRDLPRVIHTAMPLITILYILVNVSYFLVLPMSSINSANTVAVLFGSKVFGPIGALLLALIVGASCFGSLNASTFTAARITYVAGKEGYLPGTFAQLGISRHESSNTTHDQSWVSKRLARLLGDDETGLFCTPINALLLNGLLAIVYIIVGEFGALVIFCGVAQYTFYFLTVLGLIVLRVREPDLERPYRTWISTPIIFCCVSLFLLSRSVFAQPLQSLIVVAFVISGVPVYLWRTRRREGAGSRTNKRASAGTPWWMFWDRGS